MEDDTQSTAIQKTVQGRKKKQKRQIILSSIIAEGILKEAEGNKPSGI